jgi:hypothetical protein
LTDLSSDIEDFERQLQKRMPDKDVSEAVREYKAGRRKEHLAEARLGLSVLGGFLAAAIILIANWVLVTLGVAT